MSTRRAKVWLGERVDLGRVQGERVDRDARVIRRVKVLGLKSRNGRRYSPEAVEAARALYEGVSVRANHPKKATDQRDVHDVFGWLDAVEIIEGELYANLHWLVDDELSQKLCEAAERKPDLFGLSHNADGVTEVHGGEVVVLEITEVRSVDLVADPATVDGLFEGVHRVPTKLKAFMEAAGRKLSKAHRRLITRLFEDGMMDPGQEIMEEPPAEAGAPADHEQALRQGFEGSCQAIITQALDGELDPKEALKKLKELMATHQKLTSGSAGASEAPVEESDEEDEERVEEGCDEDRPMKESVELKLLRKEKKARQLCEAADVVPDSVLLESLSYLPSEAAMKRAIEREKGKAPTGNGRKPRTQTVQEGRGGNTGSTREIKDGKGFAASLREGRFSGN